MIKVPAERLKDGLTAPGDFTAPLLWKMKRRFSFWRNSSKGALSLRIADTKEGSLRCYIKTRKSENSEAFKASHEGSGIKITSAFPIAKLEAGRWCSNAFEIQRRNFSN